MDSLFTLLSSVVLAEIVLAAWFFRASPAVPPPPVELREIAVRYFEENPDAKDSVVKAYFAYHALWHLQEPGTHHFLNASRESRCSLCGRSREMVRWDELPGPCSKHAEAFPSVESVILGEEQAAFALLERAESFAPGFLAKHGFTGRALFVLHGTHGIAPELVQGVTPAMMVEYERLREADADRTRVSRPVEIVQAVS